MCSGLRGILKEARSEATFEERQAYKKKTKDAVDKLLNIVNRITNGISDDDIRAELQVTSDEIDRVRAAMHLNN